MPTLAANQSLQINLPVGQLLRFDTVGQGVVTLANNEQIEVGKDQIDIGPFKFQQVINLSAQSGISWNQYDADYLPNSSGDINLTVGPNKSATVLTSVQVASIDDSGTNYGPQYLEAYENATGFTTGGSVASFVWADQRIPGVGGGVLTSTAAGTTTMYAEKATAVPYAPASLGVVAALIKVNGQKSGRVLRLGNDNVIFADNATTPLLRDGWAWIAAHVSEFPSFAAGATAAITPRLSIQLSGNTGTTTAVFGGFLANAGSTPLVTLTFDDLEVSQYNIGFPIMQDAGIVGTVYVPTAKVGDPNKMTLNHLREMRDAGWAISTNGTPDDTSVSTTQTTAVDAFRTGMAWIVANGLSVDESERHGCWPNNSWSEARCAAAQAAGMLTMRTTTGNLSASNQYTVFDQFGLGSQSMTLPSWSSGVSGIGASFANAKQAIDIAVMRKSSIHLHFHDIVESGAAGTSINRDVFTQLVQYLGSLHKAGTIRVVNRPQYWRIVSKRDMPIKY